MDGALEIVYVEDSAEDATLLGLTFEKHQEFPEISLTVATTVEEARKMVDPQVHHGVLIDWNLPDGDGSEVADNIRQKDEDVPIVFLSSEFPEDIADQAKPYYPMTCIQKSYGLGYVREITAALLTLH